ncbi:unnamed protein product [Lactuca saligna]|uniref:Uncharacterized protein n=1 Tax=Lactuca saligna TaxID=75948 RepID=A0AA36DWW8_LACSI|nr:unnamed protein product [Lactuca saligna]
MLNQIEGVSENGDLLKQGGYKEDKGEPQANQTTGEQEQEQKLNTNDQEVTPRASLFRCFEKIERVVISDKAVKSETLQFLLEVCQASIPVLEPNEDCRVEELPFMNPYDWILMFNIVMKDEKKYEPIVAHLKKMIICYIREFAKMDLEIPLLLEKKPDLEPEEQPQDVNRMKLGVIQKEH